MTFRNLDSDGDWTFGKGLNNYAKENQAIGLDIKTRLLSWLEDCFFDMQAGVNWKQRLGKPNQTLLLENDIRRIITQTENVTGINTLDIIVNGRSFTVSYDIETIYSKSFSDRVEENY